MRVSVIVPVYNSPGEVAECLAAVRAQSWPDYEMIAVDDASTDATPRVAEAAGARVFRLDLNSGPGTARDLGGRHASGVILLFVDQDVVIAPGVVARVARTFADRPELGAVFGSYDSAPRARGLVSQFRNLLHHYVHQRGDAEASTFWAGCGAVRREAFEQVGGFGAGRVLEDIELGYRLRRSGYRIRLDRELQVTHLKAWTLASMIRTDITKRAIPWTRLILRTRNAPAALNLEPAQRWSVALTGAALGLASISVVEPRLAVPSAAAVLAVLALNLDFYRFLRRTRGVGFALASVPLHLIYFICCGIGAAYAWLNPTDWAARGVHRDAA